MKYVVDYRDEAKKNFANERQSVKLVISVLKRAPSGFMYSFFKNSSGFSWNEMALMAGRTDLGSRIAVCAICLKD